MQQTARAALPWRIYALYRDGFRSMRLGRTLWTIIIIKLLIIFGVLKIYFFPDYLQSRFDNDQQRAAHVLENISRPHRPTNPARRLQ